MKIIPKGCFYGSRAVEEHSESVLMSRPRSMLARDKALRYIVAPTGDSDWSVIDPMHGRVCNYTSSWRRLTSSRHAAVEVGHVRDRPFDNDCMSGGVMESVDTKDLRAHEPHVCGLRRSIESEATASGRIWDRVSQLRAIKSQCTLI